MGFSRKLIDLLFPPRCVFCRKVLKRGEKHICSGCEVTIPRCENGGKQTGEYFSLCVSPLYYEDAARDSILRFKFKERTNYAKYYGILIAECVRENLPGRFDIISWVPLSARRLKSRGYDQAMLLAMAAALELGEVAAEALSKHTDVPAQSGAGGKEERQANISGVYLVPDTELVAGKRILLIDDIVTTGSTLSECARMLREAGASDVVCATLARTRSAAYTR